ncbi:hypothetical protein Tco_0707655 [Tanacetum coccineum]|uniref:Uncharacterized protein n=1 Tax=Tanacetum coccineum TaxID=301880 RepID=A0ABQ4YAV0_9ASTR
MRRAFINRFFPPSLFKHLLFEIRSFSQLVCESLTDAWLRLKNMLRNLTKGSIIQIFYHGLDKLTQEILDITAGGIFLYKGLNQAFQFLEDKAMDSQIIRLNEELQDIHNKYNELREGNASKNHLNDDTPMCERHEANYIQSEGNKDRNSQDSYSHQSLHDPNDSEKSLTELNKDVRNDLEDFKRCVHSMRTVHWKLYARDDDKTTGVLPNVIFFVFHIIMANLPPNHVADLPEDDLEEQPKLAPELDHLNVFAPHQIPQPDGNMNRWILEDDEEEEDPEMEEEMEEENDDDDDDAEVINPYEEANPLNLPPPDSDTESEDTAVALTLDDHEQEAEAATVGTITRGCQHSTSLEFDSDLRSEIKGQHTLRRNVCTLEDQVRELVKGDREENKKLKMKLESTQRDFDRLPYVAPTAPVAPVDCADADDPSSRPTHHPRHDDPYVMVRDAATRDEGDDAATTSDP